MKVFFCSFVMLTILMLSVGHVMAEPDSKTPAQPAWREDFKVMPDGWDLKTKPGVKAAEFDVVSPADSDQGVLRMRADDASGTFMINLKDVDLNKTPILRWRWRVTTFPDGADGRNSSADDQAVGVYVSYGGMLRQRSVAYRWETETPVGEEGTARYAAGVMQVKWICLRNKNDGVSGDFFVEERNVAKALQEAFGTVPKQFGIGFSCNSQYTSSIAEAEVDWIELVADE